MEKVFKKELIDYMVKESEGKITRKQIELAIGLFGDFVIDTLEAGKKFVMFGLFSVEPVYKKAKTAFNPANREPVEVPERVSVKVRPLKFLKEAVKDLDAEEFKTKNE